MTAAVDCALHLLHRYAELGVDLPGLDRRVGIWLDAGRDAQEHALGASRREPGKTIDLVKGIDHDVADAAGDGILELPFRLVVAVQVDPLRAEAATKRHVQLAS